MSSPDVQFSIAVLTTGKGELALQRRPMDAKIYAGMLSLFGGRCEKDETPFDAILRELLEELSIKRTDIELQQLETVPFGVVKEFPHPIEAHIYYGALPDNHRLIGHNGAIEVFSPEQALVRNDLIPTARKGIELYSEKINKVTGV